MAESEEFYKVASVKAAQENKLMHLANVNGVGIGPKNPKGKDAGPLCIQVYVVEKLKKSALSSTDLVPPTIDGIPTDVVEVGVIEAQAFTARVRPAVPGFSIGHYKITAGTFGCLVRDACNPCRVYILSNNHVLANSNAASIGDPILQPGPHDGGTVAKDTIAKLARFVPILYGDPERYNLVDCAIAAPRSMRQVIASITALGIPKGTVEATLGMEVTKSGRTTETTTGKVIGINATVAVNYGVGVAHFRDQIITTDMSAGGDSGSLLLSSNTREATGLLFAGSSQVTIHNNIMNVQNALGVKVITT